MPAHQAQNSEEVGILISTFGRSGADREEGEDGFGD